jgi:hypothetical protein
MLEREGKRADVWFIYAQYTPALSFFPLLIHVRQTLTDHNMENKLLTIILILKLYF